ncbi:hypothetical protein [Deinococcus phoenicis]|uniref:hypothetical protein n=1 Tax=Deinococcus phoenicis TaxID=1476583 RepID=UPI0012693B52|nr:hypothetical protein [Deinococcus phoenicis]
MTRDEQNGQKQHNPGGDLQPDGTDLTRAEAERLNALPGQGARQVPGAEPSDEYVEEHVEGVGEQGPDLLDPTSSGQG